MMKKVGLAAAVVVLIGAGVLYAMTSASGSTATPAAAPALSTQSQDAQPGRVCADDCGGDCGNCPHTPGFVDCQQAHESGQCQGHAPGNGCQGHGSGGGCGGPGPKGGCKGHGGGGAS